MGVCSWPPVCNCTLSNTPKVGRGLEDSWGLIGSMGGNRDWKMGSFCAGSCERVGCCGMMLLEGSR